jgi:hypothetical protein
VVGHIATIGQSLGACLKFARYIRRQDNGVDGDFCQFPILAGFVLLKFAMSWKLGTG